MSYFSGIVRKCIKEKNLTPTDNAVFVTAHCRSNGIVRKCIKKKNLTPDSYGQCGFCNCNVLFIGIVRKCIKEKNLTPTNNAVFVTAMSYFSVNQHFT